jgi:cytochrome c-type biogenesis protein CcsB
VSTAQLGDLSTALIYGAMAAYAVALVSFAIDISVLGDRGPLDRPRRAAAVGMSTTVLAAALHTAGVALRGLAAGRVPWANMYEFCLVFSLVAVLVFLAFSRGRDIRYLGSLVVGPALLALGLAVTVFFVAADGVQPALQSYWLVIHVSVATIAVGVLTVGAAFSVLQLLRARGDGGPRGERTAVPVGPGGRVEVDAQPGDGASVGFESPAQPGGTVAAPDTSGRARGAVGGAVERIRQALPAAPELERLAYRLNAVGFVLWTFTLVAGAIWAEAAWGRYWGWDPKEVWTFVIWVVYAGYLHARGTRGWSGTRAAAFSLVGYGCILVNFFVVNLVLTGLHSYSGL